MPQKLAFSHTVVKGIIPKHFGRITDAILFYTKSSEYTWNRIYRPYDPRYVERDYRRIDENGRRYRISDMRGPGGAEKGNPFYEVMGVSRHWAYSKGKMNQMIREGRVVQTRPGAVPQLKRYLDEMPGMPVQNLWDDLPVINNRSKEWLGYQTQKPLALLERIIATSTNPGDLVLDPFCGCGTAIEAAVSQNRRWIGVDITVLALDVVERRLNRWRGLRRDIDYQVTGIPRDIESAKRLFESSPYQFQLWALTLVDARPREGGKKGADAGVDGVIYFQDAATSTGRAIVSVKGGENVGPSMIRDLIGTVENERAAAGVFVTMTPPTRKMREAANAQELAEAGGRYIPRIQICTIADLLRRQKPELPPVYDVLSAAVAARRAASQARPQMPPTPEQLPREPELPPMPLAGGRRQASLPLDEPVLCRPRTSRRRAS